MSRRRAPLGVLLAALVAGGCGGRDCPEEMGCADLVKLTCGEDNRCQAAQSCQAALRLAKEGSNNVACRAAWCELGEAYRACE